MTKITLDCGCTYDKIDMQGGFATCNETYCAEHQAQRDAEQAKQLKNRRANEIDQRLAEIDRLAGSRLIREILLADGKKGFGNKVEVLESEAITLRAEKASL